MKFLFVQCGESTSYLAITVLNKIIAGRECKYIFYGAGGSLIP